MELSLVLGSNSGFTPADPFLSGPSPDLYIDPQVEEGRVLSGDNIVELSNLSVGGSFNPLTQGTEALQPEFEPNGINGLASIARVDSPSIEHLISFNTIPSSQMNFFLQFVWRYTGTLSGTGGYSVILTFNDLNTVQYIMKQDVATGKLESRPYVEGEGYLGWIQSISSLTQNQPYVIEVRYDQLADLHTLTIDGVLEGSIDVRIPYTINRNKIYTAHPVASGPASEISAFSFHRQIPDNSVIEERRRYLSQKYGI
jgi:hypothetical protein